MPLSGHANGNVIVWNIGGELLHPLLRLITTGGSPVTALVADLVDGLLVSAHADGRLFLRTAPGAPRGTALRGGALMVRTPERLRTGQTGALYR